MPSELDAYARSFNRTPLREGQRFASDVLHIVVERARDGLPVRLRFVLEPPWPSLLPVQGC
jgi:hypothetical protein